MLIITRAYKNYFLYLIKEILKILFSRNYFFATLIFGTPYLGVELSFWDIFFQDTPFPLLYTMPWKSQNHIFQLCVWFLRLLHNFLAESDENGDDNMGQNENGSDEGIEDQVDDSETELDGEKW